MKEVRGYSKLYSATEQRAVKSLSRVQLCDPMDCSPPGSSGLDVSRHEYWSGLPFPSPGDLPDPGIEPGSPALQADTLPLPRVTWEAWNKGCGNSFTTNFYLFIHTNIEH